jgi:hypothetical protein
VMAENMGTLGEYEREHERVNLMACVCYNYTRVMAFRACDRGSHWEEARRDYGERAGDSS